MENHTWITQETRKKGKKKGKDALIQQAITLTCETLCTKQEEAFARAEEAWERVVRSAIAEEIAQDEKQDREDEAAITRCIDQAKICVQARLATYKSKGKVEEAENRSKATSEYWEKVKTHADRTRRLAYKLA